MIFTVQRKDNQQFWIEELVNDEYEPLYRIVYDTEDDKYFILYMIGYSFIEIPDYSVLPEDELFCQYCSYDFEYLKLETIMQIQIQLPYIIPYCTLFQPSILKIKE